MFDSTAGRKIRKTFPTLAAAKAWRIEALAAVQLGTLRASEAVTVRDAALELVAGMEAGSVRNRSGDPYKPSVIRGYRQLLEDHVVPAIGAMRLGDVRRRHVQAIADELLAAGYTPSTVRNALLPLRVIYRRAIRAELVTSSPCEQLDLPASRGRRDRIVGPDVAAALVAALPAPFDRALWSTALYAGLRRGELLALRWSDVDLDAGVVHVQRSYDPPSRSFVEPKSRAGRRRVPIAAPLRRALLEHRIGEGRPAGAELVFGEHGQPFAYDVAVDRAARAWALAALESFLTGDHVHGVELEPIGLHEARHTCASTMIAAGANLKAVSEVLGHASITTTLDRYGHLLPGSLDELGSLLDGYLERSGGHNGGRDGNPLQITDSARSPKP